jgi:hypothetical protein
MFTGKTYPPALKIVFDSRPGDSFVQLTFGWQCERMKDKPL